MRRALLFLTSLVVAQEANAPIAESTPAPASVETSAPRARVVSKPSAVRPAPAEREVELEGAWGGGPGQFGRRREEEANPEAPMAIAAAQGALFVVDQVNHRVQRFEHGKPAGALPISETVQD